MTVRIGLLGAGRIGQVHAAALKTIDGAELAAVFDLDEAAANQAITGSDARADTLDGIMSDPAIDAVIIATPTDLHADQIELAARAGKAIFCEKPIDLSIDRVRACLTVVEETKAPLMVGFNRRFDPSFAELHRQIQAGAIGTVELVQITSRDPAPPPQSYIARSGGLFRDMMIHDFDMARFLLGEEVAQVSAHGSALFDAGARAEGDVDTATATLQTASGKICTITNSRRATYGYDQRVEVHGSDGMIAAENAKRDAVTIASGKGYTSAPLLDFFMERYREAYRLELTTFVNCLRSGTDLAPTGADGLRALQLANAAIESLEGGQTVKLLE